MEPSQPTITYDNSSTMDTDDVSNNSLVPTLIDEHIPRNHSFFKTQPSNSQLYILYVHPMDMDNVIINPNETEFSANKLGEERQTLDANLDSFIERYKEIEDLKKINSDLQQKLQTKDSYIKKLEEKNKKIKKIKNFKREMKDLEIKKLKKAMKDFEIKKLKKAVKDLEKEKNDGIEQLREKNDEIKQLNTRHDGKLKKVMEEVEKEINDGIEQLREKNDEIKQINTRHDGKLKKAMEELEKEKNDEIKQLDEKLKSAMEELEKEKNDEIKQLDTRYVGELKKVMEEAEKEIQNLRGKFGNRLDVILKEKTRDELKYKVEILTLDDKIQNIEKRNRILIDENRNLQNYIGKATTFSLSDDDKNHNIQFVKDIENLQTMIMGYVGNLRPNIEVNFTEVNKLLRNYGSKSYVNSLEGEFILIKTVLQRHVFQEIIKCMDSYFSKSQTVYSLEHKISEEANNLLESLYKFSMTRDGANDITKAWPIKIRQQIYAFLGNLGFEDIIKNESKEVHPFIHTIGLQLNRSINTLRTIKDPKKKKLHDDMATNLIREVTRIYYFRLKIQEPIAVCHWFKYNDKINPNLMKGRWNNGNNENDENDENDESDENDENDKNDEEINNNNLLVDLCYFPLFVANFRKDDQKIYTPAYVVHQCKTVPQGLLDRIKKTIPFLK